MIMLEFQEKRKLRRFMYSKVTLFFLIILIIFLLNSVWKVYQKQAMTRENLAKTASALESLQTREEMLSSEIERLQTKEGTEEEIRAKYGLVKPGEEVIIIVDDNKNKSVTSISTSTSFWQKVKDWLE